MKKTLFFVLALSLFLLLTPRALRAHALTNSVNVTTTGDSHTSVHTSTNESSSTTTTSTSNSHSKVTVTCNGKTYTYESSGENIEANPCDGNSKVSINNNGTTTVTTPNPTEIKKAVDQKKEEVKKKVEEVKKKVEATITAMPTRNPNAEKPTLQFDLGAWIRSFFSSLFNK